MISGVRERGSSDRNPPRLTLWAASLFNVLVATRFGRREVKRGRVRDRAGQEQYSNPGSILLQDPERFPPSSVPAPWDPPITGTHRKNHPASLKAEGASNSVVFRLFRLQVPSEAANSYISVVKNEGKLNNRDILPLQRIVSADKV